MTLYADPPHLWAYRDVLRGLHDDSLNADTYLSTYSEMSWTDTSMFVPVLVATKSIAKALQELIDRVAFLSDGSATELNLTGLMYHSTDAEVAQKLDDTY